MALYSTMEGTGVQFLHWTSGLQKPRVTLELLSCSRTRNGALLLKIPSPTRQFEFGTSTKEFWADHTELHKQSAELKPTGGRLSQERVKHQSAVTPDVHGFLWLEVVVASATTPFWPHILPTFETHTTAPDCIPPPPPRFFGLVVWPCTGIRFTVPA